MSVDLGSARGQIILDSSGVTKGVRVAVSALKDFESQTAGTGKNLDRIGQSGERAGSQVAKGAQQAAASVRELAASTKDVGGAFDKLSGTAAVVGGGLAAGLALAVKSAADLQTAVARVSTIAPDIDTGKVTSELSDMSTRVAQTSTQLAESLNNIFSSIETNQEDALKLTEEFGRGAVAAGTDAATFGTAVLGVMNAYGLAASDAGHISDVFFNTIKTGVISGDQLAHGLGQVTQQAKLAGVDLNTLGALIAGVTREGGDASTNLNNLSNVLNKIATEDVQKGLADLGIATKDASGNFRDIVSVLTDLNAKLQTLSAGDRAKVLQNLFPDAQARAGISTLLSQLDTVKSALDDNASSAGSAAAAYEKMGSTAAAQGQLLKNQLTATLVELGNLALPNIVGLAEHVRDLVAAFGNLPTGVQQAIVDAAALSAVFLLVSAGAIKVVSTVVQIAGAMQAAGAAAATAAKALATYATSAEVASLATAALPPALIAVGLAAAGTALTMDQMATGTKKAADAIGGDLGTALKQIDTSKMEGVLAFLTGINSEAEKAGAATHAWAADKSLPQLVEEIKQAGVEFDRLNAEGKGNTAEAATIREVIDALFDEIAARERLAVALGHQHEAEQKRMAEREPPEPGGGLTDAEKAAQRLGIAVSQLAPTFAQTNALIQQMGGVAGDGAQEVDTLTTSYFANAQAAAAMAAQESVVANLQALRDHLAGLQTEAQGVTSSVEPLQAALDLLNSKVAAGIPLTAEQSHLLATLPGYIASATSGYDGLITNTAQAAIAIQNANAAAQGGGSTFPTLAGQAAALQGALDDLRASAIQLEGALGALGTENSKLGAEYNILNERVQALNDKKKEGKGLSADEAAELATLQGALDKLGGQMGLNAAQQRDYILQLLGIQDQTANTTGALNTVTNALGQVGGPSGQAAGALVGLTDGFGNVETAAGSAFTPVQGITNAINNLPTSKTVAVDFKVTGIGAAGDAKFGAGLTEFGPGEGPGDIQKTITVTADTSDADTKLATVKQTLSDINTAEVNAQIGATDNASGIAATVTGGIKAIPEIHATEINAVDNASGVIGTIQNEINNLPTSFTIVASVDTGGALAAIADLRANMPSSPAEKGPFRTLPDWTSVFTGLDDAGDAAVETTQTTVQRLAAAIDSGMSDAEAEAAKGAADLASSVASAVNAALDAITALRSFRPPDPRKFQALHDAMLPILDAFAADAAGTSEEGRKAAAEWADNAGKIFASVSAGADALAKLRGFLRPADQALRDFRDASQFLANLMLQIAQDTDAGLAEAGARWAEAAQSIFSAVGTGVDALTKLADFQRPTDRAATDFRDISQFLVNLFAQVAHDIEDEALPKAKDWAETASAIFSAVGGGVDALTKLQDFARPTDQAVQSFRDVAQFVVNLFAQVAHDIEDQALPKAEAWATAASAIFGAIGAGVQALTGLDEFERPTDEALRNFRDVAQFAVNLIAEVAAQTDTELVAAAAVYAEGASKVLSLIGTGVQTLGKLGDEEFKPPDRATLQRIADSTRDAAIAVAAAAATIDAEVVTSAAEYAEGAGKAVALIGQGFAAFKDIATFVPPSEAQIRNLVNVTAETVRRIAEAAQGMDQEAVKAAGEFGENGGKAIGVVGATLSAFANMKDFVAPSKEGIDEVIAVVDYTAHRLASIAQGFDPALLTKLGEFGDGVSSGLSAVRAALDIGKSFQDEDRVKPADAIGTALAEFQAGLVPLDQLVTLSEEYKLKGAAIGANFAQAYADIAASLPGFFPDQAAAAANVTVNAGQTTVVHRFEGNVQFEFLAENGTWIVKSLTVDDAALADTTNLIAGKLREGFADAAMQA